MGERSGGTIGLGKELREEWRGKPRLVVEERPAAVRRISAALRDDKIATVSTS